MGLVAGDVALPQDLMSTFRGIGNDAKKANTVNNAGLKKRFTTDARPNKGGYFDERQGIQQGFDTANLESSLGGALGETAYKNKLGTRGYDENSALADQIGALNKPNLLQQIFQGVGAVGKPLSMYYGMSGMRGNRSPGAYPSTAMRYDTAYDPYADLG